MYFDYRNIVYNYVQLDERLHNILLQKTHNPFNYSNYAFSQEEIKDIITFHDENNNLLSVQSDKLLQNSQNMSNQNFDELFEYYGKKYEVSPDLLKKIAFCESRFNPLAKTKLYSGLFQFSERSWIASRKRMNLDINPDLRYSPIEAIKTAAFKISIDRGSGAWPVCGK
jgi:soluble lytic murein transglycosylase-like protein